MKSDLRLKYIKLRKDLTEPFVLNASLAIANRLLALPIWVHETYHLFLPIAGKKEVDTSFILSILHGKDKNVVLPKVADKNRLDHYLLTDSTTLKMSTWGIPEPVNGIAIAENTIDVVFIPLLAFDLNGNRVGYGAGFYDRFLANCKKDVLKVGVSIFDAEQHIGDTDENDIPLDYCVTPTKTYSFISS